MEYWPILVSVPFSYPKKNLILPKRTAALDLYLESLVSCECPCRYSSLHNVWKVG